LLLLHRVKYREGSTEQNVLMGTHGRWISFSFRFVLFLQHGTWPLSELDYYIAPTGMEATYPEETQYTRPGVSILIEGTRVIYDALGFRIVVPSQHTLGGKEFAAELQIVHGKHTGDHDYFGAAAEGATIAAPPFIVLGIWIDPKTTLNSNDTTERRGSHSEEALGEVLVQWQTVMDSRETLCNWTSDGVVAEGTRQPEDPDTGFSAPSVVVGRGSEQNFENDPIRRRRILEEFANHTPTTPYDWWGTGLSSSRETPFSFYAYERGVGACNETTVLWNLAEAPLEITHEQLAKMRSLLLGYKDANCQPPPASPLCDTDHIAQTRNANAVTRVCTTEKRPSNKASSNPMASPLFGAVMTVFASMSTLFL
jgi:hypothetical protein